MNTEEQQEPASFEQGPRYSAARNAHHLTGLQVYDSIEDLQSLMQSEFPEPPPPARPGRAEDRFIRALRRLSGLEPAMTG